MRKTVSQVIEKMQWAVSWNVLSSLFFQRKMRNFLSTRYVSGLKKCPDFVTMEERSTNQQVTNVALFFSKKKCLFSGDKEKQVLVGTPEAVCPPTTFEKV